MSVPMVYSRTQVSRSCTTILDFFFLAHVVLKQVVLRNIKRRVIRLETDPLNVGIQFHITMK